MRNEAKNLIEVLRYEGYESIVFIFARLQSNLRGHSEEWNKRSARQDITEQSNRVLISECNVVSEEISASDSLSIQVINLIIL